MIKLRYGQDKYSVPADAQSLLMAVLVTKLFHLFNKPVVVKNPSPLQYAVL